MITHKQLQFALQALASNIKMTILLPAPSAAKLKPVVALRGGGGGCITPWGGAIVGAVSVGRTMGGTSRWSWG